jgi:phospholipase/lecithinase/hemolysin
MKRMPLLLLSILLSSLLISCGGGGSPGQKKPISQIFAFGDSLSDNGAIEQLTKKMVSENVPDAVVLPDSNLYWQGHWTNGLTAVEVLADRLQIPLTDYAVGGAKSGNGNTIHWLNPYEDTGVLGQIDKFKATLKDGRADPDALYFIFASANDFGEHEDYSLPGTLPDLADQAVANIETAVSRLAEMGAMRFLVGNSAHLSIMPFNITQRLADRATVFQTRFNSELPARLDKLKGRLGVDITLFDYTATIDKIRNNPAQYDLKNLTKPCQPIFFGVGAVCTSPDEYFFWDESHPTRRVHQIVGEAMAAIFGK